MIARRQMLSKQFCLAVNFFQQETSQYLEYPQAQGRAVHNMIIHHYLFEALHCPAKTLPTQGFTPII